MKQSLVIFGEISAPTKSELAAKVKVMEREGYYPLRELKQKGEDFCQLVGTLDHSDFSGWTRWN